MNSSKQSYKHLPFSKNITLAFRVGGLVLSPTPTFLQIEIFTIRKLPSIQHLLFGANHPAPCYDHFLVIFRRKNIDIAKKLVVCSSLDTIRSTSNGSILTTDRSLTEVLTLFESSKAKRNVWGFAGWAPEEAWRMDGERMVGTGIQRSRGHPVMVQDFLSINRIP